MKLCTCNKCGDIFEDMNPQVDAIDFPNIPDIYPLERIPIEELGIGWNWGCPNCKTDAYLSDEVPWKITDASTGQVGRHISTYKFEFWEIGAKREIIDLERYSWVEICDCCESYYENMDELFEQCGHESCWIIAECLFELGLIKS